MVNFSLFPMEDDRHLPVGIVTFLFTDIEGSTHLLQQLGDEYARLIADHHRLLSEVFEAQQGLVVSTQGDSFFVAFASAPAALAAVVQAQHALAAHPWPAGVRLPVRMGLHTGEPQLSRLGYLGLDVHRAARIAAAAHGGQVLLSQTTLDLVRGALPAGVTVRDLGEHRLKDLRQPKHLYQLVMDGLRADFPPIRSLEAAPHNLPPQVTSFIGREPELAEVRQRLAEHRLVTLTGPGGSGKTRLALQVAAAVAPEFPSGVCFVALTAISDPGLVAATIAQALNLAEAAGRSLVDQLKDYLQTKALLLVLDNFEQVTTAAPLVGELLAACGRLKVLATSRAALHVSGEQLYPVPPLPIPARDQPVSPESAAQCAAVALFVQRAQAVKPAFSLTPESAPAVAEICQRLEGLPLAIELAAARIRLLPPSAMLSRLENRLEFLTDGGRDLPARQQTLRNAIAWSHDLLTAEEQQLFRRLSVFVGGGTLEAVAAVAGSGTAEGPLLDRLGSLLDKSLVREVEDTEGQPRLVMLELLREFAAEQLAASGEAPTLRHQHAAFFLALAEQAEGSAESGGQVRWLNRLEQEHDNLRAALEWSRSAAEAGDICVRLASSLGLFWEARGHFSEGRERLATILTLDAAQGPTPVRAKLLARAAELAYRQSDYPATITLAEESLTISRGLGDQPRTASALIKLANALTEQGNYGRATRHLEEALGLWRELRDRHGIARALISLGWVALRSGEHQLATARLEEALALSRELGDARSMGFELAGLGELALREGDYARATQLMEESLALRRQSGHKWGVGGALGRLGWVAMRERDWESAAARLTESLKVRQEISDKGGTAWCLERLAGIAIVQGRAERAVRLLGAAAALRAAIGSVIDPVDQANFDRNRQALVTKLGQARFKAARAAGRAMSMEQAVAYALEGDAPA